MADNYFSRFDDQEESDPIARDVPTEGPKNYFSVYDSEPDNVTIVTKSPPVITPPEQSFEQIPGVSWVDRAYETMNRDNAERKRKEKEALDTKRGNSFLEGIADPQQYGEFAKGIIPGAVRFTGTTLKGAAGLQSSSMQASKTDAERQLAILDSLDRGEQPADATGFEIEVSAYQGMTPEQRQAYRERLAGFASPVTATEDRTLFKAGQKVTDFAETILPADPAYREAVGRQLGEGIGSMIAGLPAGFLGRIPALAFFGSGGSGEAVERAIQHDKQLRKEGKPGLTEQQIATSALWGVAPGATDLLPVEVLLGRLKIPQPFRKPFAQAIGRIGGQAFIEGLQEGGQAFLQNVIAQQVYNPEQQVGEGILPEAGLGAGVGAIAETSRQIIARFAGRRGGGAPVQSEDDLTIEELAEAIDNPMDQGQQVARETKQDKLEVQQPVEGAQGTQAAPETGVVEPEAVEQPATESPVPDTAFGGDQVSSVERFFENPNNEGKLARLSNSGFTPDEIAGLQQAGMADENGAMSADQFDAFMQARDDSIRRSMAAIGSKGDIGTSEEAEPAALPITPEELQAAEQEFILPAIEEVDSEIGSPVIAEAYGKLTADEKAELIERIRDDGDQIADVIEEMAIRNEDLPTIAAMAMRRGATPEQIAQLRSVIQQASPELAGVFDELVAALPKPRQARARTPEPKLSDAAKSAVSTLEAQTSQADLTRAIAELGGQVSVSDWKTIARSVTGRNFPSGKQARDAVHTYYSDQRLIDERVEGVKRLFGTQDTQAAQPRGQSIEQRVSDVYWRLARRPQDWVPMRELRAALPDVPRAELDAALKSMYLGKAINVSSNDDQGSLTKADREASLQMGASRIDMLSMQSPVQPQAEATSQRPATELRQSFANILNSRTPKSKWASELGVTDAELEPLIEDAVRKGFLRRDKNGNVRRVPQSQRPSSFAAMVIPDNLPETMPGEGDVALTPEAEEVWPEAKAAINRAASAILPAAVKVDVVDNIAIAALKREDQMLALREEAAFRRWFGDSKVVDENGEPLVVYHGSGNIENLEAFDPTFTGQGNDQLGSGFYFSTRPETASDYTTRRLTDDQQKLGGESSPGIVPVYVAMNNPIVLHGNDMISNAVDLTADQAEAIIRRAPNLYDVDETPLGNWHDVWSEGVQDHMIADVAQSYTGPTLISLENDFFRGQSTIFRQALQDVLGYDGVIQEFDTGEKHIVAWFPTQIKSAIGNRGTFDPIDPRISYALRKTEPDPSAIEQADNIRAELDRIDGEIRKLSAGLGAQMRIPSAEREASMQRLRKERGELIEAYAKLPLEARAAKDSMFALRAFHGSPHDFDRFDLSRIGTGEGAQAFGHGLYFAENELVARSYQNVLAAEGITLDGEAIAGDPELMDLALTKLSGQNLEGQSLDDYEQIARSNLERVQSQPEPTEAEASRYFTTVEAMRARQAANLEAAQDYLAKVQRVKAGEVKSPGQLYEVEIDVEPEQLLDWDKPLSEQSAEIKELMRKRQDLFPDESVWPEWTGEQLYRGQAASYAGVDWARVSEKTNASKDFREAGIPGIRYLDQGSRDAGEGSRNIVIFDDSLVKITKKNGKPVSTAERKQVVDQMFALRGFHSSPYDFNRFDMSKIGAGEGAQAFGWGLYFADSEKVAGHYALSVPDQQLLREARDAYDEFEDPDSALELLLESPTLTEPQKRFLSALAKDDWFGFDYPHQAVRAALRDDPKNWDASQETLDAIKGLSVTYEVDIKADEKDFLDWDKPVTEQPLAEKIGDIWFRGNPKAERADLVKQVFSGWTGRDLYKQVARGFGNDEAASKYLAQNGIAGIRYLDQASRRKGEGTRNTVVFDDKIIEITHKDGKPVSAEERQGVIDEMFSLRSGSVTETEAFKRWFKDSKVVDENGRPKVVYHGTQADFEAFDPKKGHRFSMGALYFTDSPRLAEDFTDIPNRELPPGQIMPVYLSLQNPVVVDFEGREIPSNMGRVRNALVEAARGGHDGVILNNAIDTVDNHPSTIYLAFDPTQIKSIFNRGTFDPTDPRISFALRGFYSPAIRAAENLSQNKGTGEQFLKQITKAPGVRKDELEWMGLEEFLAGKKSITKDEVLSFMRAHQVELDEKILSGAKSDRALISGTVTPEQFRRQTGADEAAFPDAEIQFIEKFSVHGSSFYVVKRLDSSTYTVLGLGLEEIGEAASRAQAEHMGQGWAASKDTGPRFSGDKVPGGENYRELLIRLPELGEIKFTAADQKRLDAVHAELDRLKEQGLSSFDPRLSHAQDEVDRLLKKKTQPAYKSRHFHDQEIVHLRVDDRVGPNGEKILFVNEIQSDLHQKGRKQGYGKPKLTQKQLQLRLEIADISKAMRENPAGSPEWMRAIERERELRSDPEFSAATQKLEGSRMPDAPFKGDLWLELALKRALLYASENGYDAVSWARSDQIAKAVGGDAEELSVQYDQKIGRFLKKYTKKWGGKVEEENLGVKDQIDIEKLSPQKREELASALERDGYGEEADQVSEGRLAYGTQEFILNKYADEFGLTGAEPNPILRLTPEMRSSVMEGQPVYARTDNRAREHVIRRLSAGRPVSVEQEVVAAAMSAIQPIAIPEGVRVGAITRLSPMPGGDFDATFTSPDGSDFHFVIDRDDIWNGRAIFHPPTSTILSMRFGSFPGTTPGHEFVKAVRGEVYHEITHAVWRGLSDTARNRLAGHAESLKILDMSFKDYLNSIGDPSAIYVNSGESVRIAYEEAYRGRQNLDDLLAQESVAHMVELYSHGVLTDADIAPVRSLLDGVLPGIQPTDDQSSYALRGGVDPHKMIISIAMNAVEAEAKAQGTTTEQEAVRVLRREALKFFKDMGMFTEREWNTLKSAAKRNGWVETAGVRRALAEAGASDVDLIATTAIAEQYSEFHLGKKQFKGVVAEVFQRIKDFIDRTASFMRGEGFQTWEDVFERIDEGEFKQRFNEAFPEMAPQREQLADVAGQTLPTTMPNLPLSPPPPGPTPGLAPSPAGSLIDIQRNLRKRLGLTTKRGRLDPGMKRLASQMGGMLRGQYSRQTGVIRLAVLEDIDTEAHEVAHALESRYDLDPLKARHQAALLGIARMSRNDTVSEGFAEFFRLYLTNPQAAEAHAPDFFNEFEEFMDAQDPQTLADIQEIRDQYQDWRNASSAGRIIASTKSGVPEGTWAAIRKEYNEGGMAAIGGMYWRYLERVYQGRFDKTNSIRKLMMRIARQAEKNNQDVDLSAWRNPQMQAQKIGSADAMGTIDIMKGVHWENSAGKGAVSLKDALSRAFNGNGYEEWSDAQRDAFGAYLIGRRGRWLWQRFEMDPARNRGRLANAPEFATDGDWYYDTMKRQRRVMLNGRWENELLHAPDKHNRGDHLQTVVDLEAANPQFAEAADMVYQFLRDLALKRYQAGLDTLEEYQYKINTPDYVPWFRDMSDEIFKGTAISGRQVAQKFKLRGSYRDFINPIEGIVRQVYDTNHEIAVNKPKLLLAQMAESVTGAGQYAEVIPATRMKVEEVKIRDALAYAFREEGIPPEDAKQMISAVAAMVGDDAVAKLFSQEQAREGRDAIVHYMDNGQLKMLQIHDDGHGIAKDILGFFETVRGTPFGDSFFNMLVSAVRVPQRGITAHPGFLWRNLIRDTFNAAVMQAGYFPIVSNIRTVASNVVRRGRGEETWSDIIARHGGIMGGLNRTNIQQLRQGRTSELRTDGVVLQPWRRDFWARTMNPFNEDFWKWAEWSEANARQTLARIAFNRALNDAQQRYPDMPPEQQTFVALESAVQQSRDYTDYGRMGDFASQVVMNRLIMFLNPALQGPDKMIRKLFLAQTPDGRFAAAQAVRKQIAPLFNRETPTKPLTKSEKDALKDALRAWTTVAMIAVTHLMIELLFNDDDELEDKSEMERALNVPMTINGQPYRIPRGFDVVNVASNAVRATYDSWKKEDPTAWRRFRDTLGYSLVPPHSSPLLDMYIGWKHGRNNFFDSAIEPEYMKGLLPGDRYRAYTSKLSRDIAEGINSISPTEVSPLMVEYTLNTIGSDWARDILRAYDAADPDKPALRWQEYPFVRTTRGLRGTRGSEDFWNLMGREGEFMQPAGSYKQEAVDDKVWSPKEIRKFFEQRVSDDDAKAFSVLNGHYDIGQRRLHPMQRAREFITGLNATARAVASNRIEDPRTEKRAEVSRAVRSQANEIIAEITRREYLNALIALQRPGYEFREPQPVQPYMDELKTISPDIYKVLIDKITNKSGPKVYDYETVRELWPEVRRRLLDQNKIENIIEETGQVEFKDLAGPAARARARGIRR